ncbi:hypothetical protein NFI96_024091 [Prochilodus magdalenae]|nr:hypothetical protein NFI96_024091 [Prochilodus magdalenae]
MGKFSLLIAMNTIILILQGLFINIAIPGSYVIYPILPAFSEPTESDLECFNDYDTEMKCYMNSDKAHCSEYKLNITRRPHNKFFECRFENGPRNNCQCTFQVPGFTLNENFRANLQKTGELLSTKNINTGESIKPKRPIIVSVNLTENGNFLITWDTNYTSPSFRDSLSTELTYSINGSKDNSSTQVTCCVKGRTDYEIVGRNLQSNSVYVVMARVTTEYNSRFSDYSQPYKFSTPPSVEDILKIIIPISCVILIIFISILFYCYIKLKRELWDKFPSPEIALTFKKQIHILLPPENEFSPLHIENSSLDLIGNKTWTSSQADVSSEHYNHLSLGTSVDSALEGHVQVDPGNVGHDSSINEVAVNAAATKLETSMSYSALENLQSTKVIVTASSTSGTEKDSGNSSGLLSFSNKSYFDVGISMLNHPIDSLCKNGNFPSASTNFAPMSASNKIYDTRHSDTDNAEIQKKSGNNLSPCLSRSSSLLPQPTENEKTFPALPEKLHSVLETDFDYGPCNGCSRPADANSVPKSTPSSNKAVVVHGYQSLNELLDHRNKPEADAIVNQAFISVHDDVNLITAKSIGCKKPQDVPLPACESTIIPVDDGYQSLPSLDQNTWSSDHSTDLGQNSTQSAQTVHHSQQVHAPSLKSPVLNISPGIQIDCSYQRV